jgi:hypothetical protein
MTMAPGQTWIDAPVTKSVLYKKMKKGQNNNSGEPHRSLVRNNKIYILCGGA